MQCFHLLYVLASLLFYGNFCLANESLLVIVRSQTNGYHQRLATENKARLDVQIKKHDLNVDVAIMHELWNVEYAWTVLPLLSDISEKFSSKYNWIMFIEDITKVDVIHLMNNVLSKYNANEEQYIGRCLFDKDSTIIHHYAFFNGKVREFKYPDFHAGWIISKALLQKIGSTWDSSKIPSDFQIDIQHEIAMYLDKTFSIKMTCENQICGGNLDKNCATWVDYAVPDCGTKIALDNVLVSVKTTKKFHDNRVQIVKKTWGKYPKHIIYYSNVTEPEIPTIDCGVPNTVRGHCGKMEVIIRQAFEKENLNTFPWLVIADDDSIIGLSALVKLLNCYNSDDPIVLGERYGYGLTSARGYSYITGGGSMVMSRGAIKAWVEKDCRCHTIDSPDDMVLGQCFSYSVGAPVVHSPRFHQARPQDYSDGYLQNLQPVSFHKHYEIDPIKVYEKYFAKNDDAAFTIPNEPEPTEAPVIMPVPIPPTPTEVPIKDEL